MSKIVFGEALRALQSMNDSLIQAYREGARGLPPGPVQNLVHSMTEQRKELAKTLTDLSALPACRAELELDADIDLGPSSRDDSNRIGARDAVSLLGLMKDAEDAEYERLSGLAGSVLSASAQAADLLAAEANAAKKRASWAQDHLDLMGLSKP